VALVCAASIVVSAGCASLIGLEDLHPPPSNDAGANQEAGVCTVPADSGVITAHACGDKGTCWRNPAPQGASLYHVWGTCGDAWAAGKGGTLMQFDGTTWTARDSSTANDLFRISGTSPSDVWFVGDFGTILHWDGSAITPFSLPASVETMVAVHASTPTDAWASSEAHAFMHWDGTAWTHVPAMETNATLALWGDAANDVWAVGVAGTASRWDGTAWTAHKTPTTGDLFDVWGSAASDVYAVSFAFSTTGDSSSILHWDGSTWTPIDGVLAMNETASQVWGGGANDVWVLGDASLHHFDGASWTNVAPELIVDDAGYSQPTAPLSGCSIGSGQSLLVGTSGGLFRGTGVEFTELDTGSRISVSGIWGYSSVRLWVAFDDGSLMQWDGNKLAQAPYPGDGYYAAMWGDGQTGLWFAGNSIWYSDGLQPFMQTPIPSNVVIGGLWGSGDGTMWAVGTSGDPVILRWDPSSDAGSRWTSMTVDAGAGLDGGFITSALTAIHGSSATDIWATGDNGGAFRYDGSTWKMFSTGKQGTLVTVLDLAPNDVWAAGTSDVYQEAMFHWDGVAWKSVPSPSPGCSCTPSCALACGGSQRLFKFGNDPGPRFLSMTGAVYKWQPVSSSWALVSPGYGRSFAFWGTTDEAGNNPLLWIGGETGELRTAPP
jgi:hypothetical protein